METASLPNTNNIIQKASRITIDDCLQVRGEDNLVIITDLNTFWMAKALEEVARSKTNNILTYVLELHGGERPLRELPEEIRGSMDGWATASIYTARGLEEELKSVRYPILNEFVKPRKIRHAHMPGIKYEHLKYINTRPSRINEFGEKLHNKIENLKRIHITTPKVNGIDGTDLIGERGSDSRWHNSYGVIEKGIWENIPSGEVFTYPVKMNGRLVVDGTIGQGFDEKFGILKEKGTPLILQIEGSRIVPGSIECENEELKYRFANYVFNTDYGSSKVGEFGIGTNPGIRRLTGSLLVDEKCIGTAHIAFGNPPQQEKIGKVWWESDAHIDCVMQKVNLYLDDKQIIEDGNWLI